MSKQTGHLWARKYQETHQSAFKTQVVLSRASPVNVRSKWKDIYYVEDASAMPNTLDASITEVHEKILNVRVYSVLIEVF